MDFRAKGEYRVIGWAGLALSSVAMIVSVAVMLFDPDGSCNGELLPRLVAATVLGGLWGAFVLLSVFLLRFGYRHRLTMTPDSLESIGAFRSERIALSDVKKVRWRSVRRLITLTTSKEEKLTIELGNYLSRDSLRIMRWVRETFPHDIQENFELFYMLRLRGKNAEPVVREPNIEAGEYKIHRWQVRPWWVVFFVLILAGTIADCFDPWLPGVWLWPMPFVTIGFWVYGQFAIPKTGRVVTKKETRTALLFGLGFAVLMAFVPLAKRYPNHPMGWWLIIGFFVVMAVALPISFRIDRRILERKSREGAELLAQLDGRLPPELDEMETQ